MLPGLAELRDFAARYTAAWCSGNPEDVAQFFAPDGSLQVNRDRPAVGREAIAAVARSFMTAFPDLSVAMDDVLVRGDEAEYRWTLSGTNSGPGGTGRRVRINGFEKWRFGADGLSLRRTAISMRPSIAASWNRRRFASSVATK